MASLQGMSGLFECSACLKNLGALLHACPGWCWREAALLSVCTFTRSCMHEATLMPIRADERASTIHWCAAARAIPGLLARMSTQLAREREEYARLAEEETDFERIVSMGLGPLDALDPDQEVPAPICVHVLLQIIASNVRAGRRDGVIWCSMSIVQIHTNRSALDHIQNKCCGQGLRRHAGVFTCRHFHTDA